MRRARPGCGALALLVALALTRSASAQADAAPPEAPPIEAVASVTSEEATLRVAAVPATVRVGDLVDYLVEVVAPSQEAVSSPTLVKGADPFELRETFTELAVVAEGERTVRRFRARLASFETGAQALPSAELLLRGASGERTVLLPAVAVTVVSVLPEGGEASLLGLKGLLALPEWLPFWVLVLLAVCALAALAFFFYRRRSIRLPAPPAAPPIPYDERALRDLRALGEGPWLAAGRLEEFFVRLTEIIRTYLGERHAIDALEMTSEELHRALVGARASEETRSHARAITGAADLVKFARFAPQAESAREALTRAVRLVESSRPRADATASAAATPGTQARVAVRG